MISFNTMILNSKYLKVQDSYTRAYSPDDVNSIWTNSRMALKIYEILAEEDPLIYLIPNGFKRIDW